MHRPVESARDLFTKDPFGASLAPRGQEPRARWPALPAGDGRTPRPNAGHGGRSFCSIGKETDRRWQQGEDISLLLAEIVEYRPDETDRLVRASALARAAQDISVRTFAAIGHVSPKTASVAKRGERLRKSTINTLTAALSSFLIKCQESPNFLTGRFT